MFFTTADCGKWFGFQIICPLMIIFVLVAVRSTSQIDCRRYPIVLSPLSQQHPVFLNRYADARGVNFVYLWRR